MNIPKNARQTPLGREHIVLQVLSGQTPEAAARAAGVCTRTARKWLRRYRAEGAAGLHDRSSRLYRPTQEPVVERIAHLRRQRWTGKATAAAVGVSPATVSRILKRQGLSKLESLEPAVPCGATSATTLGELIHIDIKKLGRFERVGHRITGHRRHGESRGADWEFVHVAIDDASRLAFSQIMPEEKKESAIAFLKTLVANYASLGVTVTRLMTDTARAIAPRRSATPAASSASGRSRPGLTPPGPMARRSASFRPR